MRKAFDKQRQFGCQSVRDMQLNLNCRDEIIPILAALQHIYLQPQLRDSILALVAADVNRESRNDCGREGLTYWQVLVLAAVRLGCNLDYDKLQDLAEQHRTLRMMMGIGDWDDRTDFGWRRIRDNVCLLRPGTIEKISHLIVGEGHRLEPEAVTTTRADSFVIDTNIHYPTESSLIRDGVRKVLELGASLAEEYGVTGWRQHRHLFKRVKRVAREIDRIASRKGANYQKRLKSAYQKLLKLATKILTRTRELCGILSAADVATRARIAEITVFVARTEQVMGTARRRVINGETVPNSEKLFSIFEPHTQLYKRGKAGEPVQFGRQMLVYEDGVGFITHHHLLPRNAGDKDVVVEQTRTVQNRLGKRIQRASFDRGFHSPDNQLALANIIAHPCLPKPGSKQSVEQNEKATIEFRQARQNHSGIESLIGALQSGNGLKRCRDRSELGLERYAALGVLGRNLHVLGRLVIAREDALCEAAMSLRRRPTAA
ncbi:MAG: ISNCY family transposase [Anaerolineae bacterium]